MNLGLQGKVVVVTGAGKEIGLAITKMFVEVLLASERTKNVTGSNYVIDGGLIKTT